MSNDKAEFEQWAEQQGLSTTKKIWYNDIYESEATRYAYMTWEIFQKEINTLKDSNREEELLKDLRKLIDMLKGTEDEYGLFERVDSYYSDSTEEALNFCNDLENKYLNAKT